MRTKGVNKEQQLKYILECRNSRLTDYQWCQEHGIHPGTFYNWVSKLKKAGYADIPDPISRLNKMPIKHEIVKLEVTPDVVMADNLPEKMEQNACFLNEPSKDSVVEIVLSNATIRFVNNTISVCEILTIVYISDNLHIDIHLYKRSYMCVDIYSRTDI